MSTDPQFDRAMRIFEQVCDLPPDQRATFVETACGSDLSLRREVESLLQSDQSGELFDAVEAGAAVGAIAQSVSH